MHEIVQKNDKPIVEFPFVKVHPLRDSHPNMLKMCKAKEGWGKIKVNLKFDMLYSSLKKENRPHQLLHFLKVTWTIETILIHIDTNFAITQKAIASMRAP
jgi:hypothetical protein